MERDDLILSELQELKAMTLMASKQALTLKEAALLTGLSVSTLYKLCCHRKIPFYKSSGGKMTYFSRNELNDWMLCHRIKTSSEIESDAINHIVTGKKGS